jgi:hypothetical protein
MSYAEVSGLEDKMPRYVPRRWSALPKTLLVRSIWSPKGSVAPVPQQSCKGVGVWGVNGLDVAHEPEGDIEESALWSLAASRPL